jgi:hypothetical protein
MGRFFYRALQHSRGAGMRGGPTPVAFSRVWSSSGRRGAAPGRAILQIGHASGKATVSVAPEWIYLELADLLRHRAASFPALPKGSLSRAHMVHAQEARRTPN